MAEKPVFEQVPLKVVKEVLEQQIKQNEINKSGGQILKQELEQLETLLLAGTRPNGR